MAAAAAQVATDHAQVATGHAPVARTAHTLWPEPGWHWKSKVAVLLHNSQVQVHAVAPLLAQQALLQPAATAPAACSPQPAADERRR